MVSLVALSSDCCLLISTGKVQGLRARTKAERQTRLLTAARMLFTEKGYEDATLNQIAAIAGLGKGTIFGFFTKR